MAKGKSLWRRLETTDAGFSQGDLASILRHHGYEFVGNARHGAIYKHSDLVAHPDEMMQKKRARVMIPVGKDLPGYAARDVRNSVKALLEYQALLKDRERKND